MARLSEFKVKCGDKSDKSTLRRYHSIRPMHFLQCKLCAACMKMAYITRNCLSPAIFLVSVSTTVLVEFSCGTKFNIIRLLNTLLVLVTRNSACRSRPISACIDLRLHSMIDHIKAVMEQTKSVFRQEVRLDNKPPPSRANE